MVGGAAADAGRRGEQRAPNFTPPIFIKFHQLFMHLLCRPHRLMPGIAMRPAMSISLSKCPMLPTMALFFIFAMSAACEKWAQVAAGGGQDAGRLHAHTPTNSLQSFPTDNASRTMMMSLLPVVVMKMSTEPTQSSRGATW